MKKIAMLLAGLALFSNAQATVYQYDFTATIQEMVEFSPLTFSGGSVTSSSLSGNLVAVGDVVHGQFSYDTATGVFLQLGSTALYSAAGSQNGISASIGGHDLALANTVYSNSNVQVANNAGVLKGGDGFGVSNVALNGAAKQIMSVSFVDKSGHALSSNAVPGALDFVDFTKASFSYLYTSTQTGALVGANGDLTSVTVTSAVPEPETYGMLLAGLGLVAFAARRKQRA
ncbi:MAG: PEP-CTERM sorting domain-containing protein [Sphingomonadaceae bacterium]